MCLILFCLFVFFAKIRKNIAVALKETYEKNENRKLDVNNKKDTFICFFTKALIMNKLLSLFLFLSITIIAKCQEVEYPCDSYIAKGKFDKAEEKLTKALNKEPDATVYYAAAMLYSSKAFAKFDIDKAYANMIQSEEAYKQADQKHTEKLNKRGYNADMYATAYVRLASLALEVADVENTISAYDHFLDVYQHSSASQKTEATNKRNALAYNEAKHKNTIEAYNQFLQKYPLSKEVKQATAERNKLAYSATLKDGSLKAFQDFIDTYPDAAEVPEAWDNVYRLAYNEAQRLNTEVGYRSYATKYPKSQFALIATEKANSFEYQRVTTEGDWTSYRDYISNYPKNKAQHTLAYQAIYSIARTSHSIEALDYVVKKSSSGALVDSALLVLHNIYAENGKMSDLQTFYDNYDFSNVGNQLLELKKNDLTLKNIQAFGSQDEFIKAAAPYYVAFEQLRDMVADDLKAKNWTKAVATVKKYAEYFGTDHNYNNLLSVLTTPIDKTIKVNNFGANINTKGDEYSSALSGDEKTLLFCGRYRKDNLGGEDIFMSTKRNGVWTKAKLISGINTSYGNEAPMALSSDGTKMILFKTGSLTMSHKTATCWSEPENFPENINIDSWQCDAMMTSDGRAIIFVSRHKTDHELSPSENIFVSLLDENGEWGKPIDLGPTINTPFCDRSPVLHPDMKTLYFCSEGHGALGGIDVFKATRLRDDSWTEWSEPVSLGKEINSTDDECWYKISTDGKKAYFSKKVKDNKDIVWLNLPEKMRPNPVATVSGNLTDPHGNPVTAEIKWEDLELHEVIGQSQTDPEDGSFFIILPMGRNYGYFIDDDKYFPLSSNLDLTTKNENVIIENDLKIATIEQMKNESIPMPLNNIFFNTGDSTLLTLSQSELTRVAQLIKKIGGNVEIGGHTDNTGDKVRNQLLSEARAIAAKEFLVSEGCDPERITTVGYGDSQPIADNKTADGRRKNRRIEIRFVQ